MDKTAHSTRTASTNSRLKNTFAPNCKNEYFTPATLAGLCRYGFSYDDLPKEGKQMVDEYMKGYRKRCSNGDGSWEPKSLLPDGVSAKF